MAKVSIIIPVYNSEKYLKKCLDSLVNQTLDDIEIIPIDDKSTDKSRNIIKRYSKKYKNKIAPIYLEKNIGQGFARNIAIDKSTGEYILFVDSDDYIALQTCEVLYKKAKEKDFDIICFDINQIINGVVKEKKLKYNSSIEGNIDSSKRKEIFKSSGYFTTRMYKRIMLIDNDIKFPVGIHYEDSMFNTLTLLYANSIAKVDESLYFYLIRENSSSNSYNQERLYDRIEVAELMLKEVKKRNIYDSYKEIIDYKYINMMVGNIHLCLDIFEKVSTDKLNYIAGNLKNNISNLKILKEYRELDKVSKLYLRVNEISPTVLIAIDKFYKSVLKISELNIKRE